VVPGADAVEDRGRRGVRIAAGAFDESDEMLGFVFGLTGIRDGRPIHWSHMLGVHPEARGRGIGRMLKEHQRKLLRERGVPTIFWTFDPLAVGNAHLNLNLLGARVVEHVVDMCPPTGSRCTVPSQRIGSSKLERPTLRVGGKPRFRRLRRRSRF
jgi:predicted GNAT superfamily acetyltransferase